MGEWVDCVWSGVMAAEDGEDDEERAVVNKLVP